MTRTLMPSAIPANNLHGDEGQSDYTEMEAAWIEHRTDLLLTERLADRDRFHDLISGIDALEIEPHLFRALANLDAKIKGDAIGDVAMTIAMSEIQWRLRIEAGIVWAEECRAEAERQLEEEIGK